MTKVNYKIENGYILEVQVSGHANFKNIGNDIVCASISSIIITTINGIIKIDDNLIIYEQKEGLIKIAVNKNNEICNILLTNMIDLLKDLENQYPKNVKLRKMV